MKNYENRDNFRKRDHTVEVALQSGEFKGSVQLQIGGNCQGVDIIEAALDLVCDIDDSNFTKNDIGLSYSGNDDEGGEWFQCVLTNVFGDDCEIEDTVDGIRRLVVSAEIIDCEIIKN